MQLHIPTKVLIMAFLFSVMKKKTINIQFCKQIYDVKLRYTINKVSGEIVQN